MALSRTCILEFLDAAILAESEIFDLESARAELEETRTAIQNRLELNANPYEPYRTSRGVVLKPYPMLKEAPVPDEKHDYPGLSTGASRLVIAIPTVIGSIVGWTFGIVGFAIALFAGYVIGCFIARMIDRSLVSGKKREHDNERARIMAENQRIKEQQFELFEKHQQYDQEAVRQLDAQIAELSDRIAALRANLDKFYAKGPIYSDYRNLPALCQFKQYFEPGRFEHFEGTDGAYNQYELEVRLGVIVSTLTDISSKLDCVEQNQRILHDVVASIDSGIKSLGNSVAACIGNLDSISRQVELQGYYAERTSNAAEFLARVKEWNTNWSDLPPQYR